MTRRTGTIQTARRRNVKLIRWIFDREWWAVRCGKIGAGIDIADGVKCVVTLRQWFGRAYVVSEKFEEAG